MSLRSPLARVRGLGSAKEGVGHWWVQRTTAIALIPLTIWFVSSVLSLVGADHAAVVEWLSGPWAATFMVLLIVATFHHAQLGMQVVIEDYVHNEAVKFASIMAIKAVAVVLGLVAVLSVLKIAFGG